MQEGLHWWHKQPVNGLCFFHRILGVVCSSVPHPDWLLCPCTMPKKKEKKQNTHPNWSSDVNAMLPQQLLVLATGMQILDASLLPKEVAKNLDYAKVWMNKGTYFFHNPLFWIQTKHSASCRYQELPEVNNSSVGICLEGLFWQVIFH